MAHPVLVPQAVPAAMSACGLKSCVVMYDGAVVGDGPFDVLFLSTEDTRTVDKCLSHTETWFEGQMRLPGSTTMDIWIKVTPDTILFAAYILRVIARRQYTGRIAPNLQVALSRADSQKFIIGARRIEVTCAQRNILYALLMRLAANRTGCVSNNFADKQVYFSEELRNQHPEDARQVQTRIIVDRLNLLRSAQATIGGLSDVQLRLLNHVQFENEQGIDHGGLRREFFTVLCAQLFGEQTGLFAKLDSSSSCVHPVASKLNAHSRDRLSLYRFAGTVLGKVVYDTCARGSPLFVNVRLSQSMRRYLLGLSCSVADFEVDDPAFFRTKIFYVQTNNMDALDETSGLELFFAEEEYDNQGRVRKIVEFKPNGSRLRVTEANKGDYLQLLSEYRLVRRVHHQLEAFAKGFRSVIDEDLVCIFSDREMELLFCGLPSVDVDDFRRHTAYIGYSITSEPIQWFWMVVRNFSQEQRARLLQFITGSSQVPLGGFVNYRPSITISYRATTRRLPCAHTCANTLDLPHYLSFEELQDKLSLAIAEGSEGFGFA
ncbi:hypothetical protein CAOG_009302 [Capsaspora owczarzaki ATCC 30864]|uniref:HECT-type E3 ubiquitin transferase n=2 Tax=Capsaspora owczarzaki (strain ATCC 30864) TaxID=595528 RepID=A0A0D2WH10_CAPO3|nr:hypothetical protein CAOG_009302 [Capsaspora owczarzaki ATCC 30864]